ISSTPYAIRSLNAAAAETAGNAAQLGGVDAVEYVQDDDPRMTDERPPAPGSGNYIQNQSAGTQPLANFDISGTGKAGAIDSSGGYRMNGDLVFHVSTASQGTFAGSGAGSVNTGFFNSFFGKDAGTANTSGSANSFFGSNAGLFTTTGSENSFFGQSAGQETSDGG